MKTLIEYATLNMTLKGKEVRGGITLHTRTYVCAYLKSTDKTLGIELNDFEICEIEYLGVSITNYKEISKFLNFHKEMGVDLEKDVADVEDDLSISKPKQKEILLMLNKLTEK